MLLTSGIGFTVDDVSDGEDVGDGGLEAFIDGDSASVVGGETHGLEAQFVGVRTSADTDQKNVAFQRFFLVGVLYRFHAH